MLVDGPTPPKDNRVKIRVETTKETVGSELDLRGLTADEASPILEKYLFDAYNSGWSSVGIIHGKGTGALRAKVTEFLSDHPLVESSRTGRPEEGDYGVTIVKLAR
jgi:DNA mismatch repair protein MutS2